MKITLTVMDPAEAFYKYAEYEGVKEEHANNKTFQDALNGNINDMIDFLDFDGEDIRKLTENEIKLLGLTHGAEYYIDTWCNNYLTVE